MNKETLELDYIKDIKRKRNLNPISAMLILAAISIGLFYLVNKGQFLNLTEPAKEYLFYTPFTKFSNSEFYYIAQNMSLAIFFSIVYWVYHVSIALIIPVIYFWFVKKIVDFIKPDFRNMLVAADKIETIISRQLRIPSISNRAKLLIQIRFLKLHQLISPIKSNIDSFPTMQWFNISSIDKDSLILVEALIPFKKSVSKAVLSNENLLIYLDSFHLLRKFILEVAWRVDEYFINITDSKSNHKYTEFELLQQFTNSAKKAIQTTNNFETKPSFAIRQMRIVNNFLNFKIIKIAIYLSLFAGLIMIVGVLIFKIDHKSAFLNWFIVSFSFISLSTIVDFITHNNKRESIKNQTSEPTKENDVV